MLSIMPQVQHIGELQALNSIAASQPNSIAASHPAIAVPLSRGQGMDQGPKSAALGEEARGHFPQPFQFSTKTVYNGIRFLQPVGKESYRFLQPVGNESPVRRGRDLKVHDKQEGHQGSAVSSCAHTPLCLRDPMSYHLCVRVPMFYQ
jgi:hypothetical protein